MLKSRMVSGIIGALLLILVVVSGVLPFRIAVALLSARMVFELFRATGISRVFFVPSALFAVAISSQIFSPVYVEAGVYCYLLLILFLSLFRHETVTIQEAGLACLFTAFIGCFMGCVTKIRMEESGNLWIWLVFVGAWFSDIFAYFSGCLFGKRKLMPAVSPKKTVAGAVGGALGGGLGFLLFGLLTKGQIPLLNVYSLFPAGVLVSICGQIGDLVASVIKRQFNIKDYGKIMPGHGGAMDRFDSILFVAPIVYLYMQLIQ